MSTEKQQPSYKHLTSPKYGDPKQYQHVPLQELTRPHIESFNFLLQHGLSRAVKSIPPLEFALPNGDRVMFDVLEASISNPKVTDANSFAATRSIYPAECRERGATYRGSLHIYMQWKVGDGVCGQIKREIGQIPIMVKSDMCNIKDMGPAELVKKGEEQEEMGGYFIINGNEKVIRMLIMPRRNSPTCMIRPSWKNRGKQYTEYGVSIRCVRPDQTGTNNTLHYLSNGTATLSFTYQKEMFFIPVIFVLKGLLKVTDKYIYDELVRGKEEDSFYKGCVVFMLRQALAEGLVSRKKVLQYIGERFRIKLRLPEWYTDLEIGEYLFKQSIGVHLENSADKFHLLIYMTKKLFCFARGECAVESADNTMNQELLLPGHLFIMFLKEKIEGWLVGLKIAVDRDAKSKHRAGHTFQLDEGTLSNCMRYTSPITRAVEYLMATGNVISKSGLGLMQNSGLTVIADKLNFYRYISHFRSIHRGAFFAQMRTTAVRKMLAESWAGEREGQWVTCIGKLTQALDSKRCFLFTGFICPVHTPDGTPCGLLNHMAALCQVVNTLYNASAIPSVLCSLGVIPVGAPSAGEQKQYYTVLLDGKVIGDLHNSIAQEVADKLRVMKVQGQNKIPAVTEICFIPKTQCSSQYPGLYIFTTPCRMMRPVKNLALDKIELIGTFEQVYMDICITPEEAKEGTTKYQELSQITMLSTVACLTPFSDFNQSPRNIYQCQMGKQTMGTPCHAWSHRSDTKLYRIQTPQCPMVRPYMHDYYNIDEYPLGTNAVVAVISYTGYDMEDAMILNKSSFERGFAHGTIHKSEIIRLKDLTKSDSKEVLVFGTKPGDKLVMGKLDSDGLPAVGTFLQEGDPYYSYINLQTGETRVQWYKSIEPAYVDSVKALGEESGKEPFQSVCIGLRIKRNPIIGDKFSSRHGQKGICSMMWPVENMPFSESGMTPDILFNPHGYPSRMTIGMMIESMAGKSAASHGLCHDATPFTFSEDQPAIDYFGKMLRGAGYSYYGTERMYSGVDGRELEADIFVGIVYYQRLRHMVSDKFQVRSTGPVDQVTHQPVKGRRRGGGIRFGEMERDAMIAHGTTFLLQDRLLNCSDRSLTHVCCKCGSILSPVLERPPQAVAAVTFETQRKWTCSVCKRSDTISIIPIPYVFRYLLAELAAMNIKVELEIK